MSEPEEIRILIDRDDPLAYQVQFVNQVNHIHLVSVLHDLINRLITQVDVGQTEHPELTVLPIPGGDDDIFGGAD